MGHTKTYDTPYVKTTQTLASLNDLRLPKVWIFGANQDYPKFTTSTITYYTLHYNLIHTLKLNQSTRARFRGPWRYMCLGIDL
jgi:hypothetical protein